MSLKSLDYKMVNISIGLCLFGGLVCAGAPFIGWSYYSMEGALTSCSVDWADRSFNVVSYNIFIFIISYFIPVAIIIYTNLKLLFIVSNSSS